MKTTHSTLAGTLCALVLALLSVPASHAQCGGFPNALTKHTGWHPQFGQARLIRTAFAGGDSDEVSIVGYWHVKFVSDGVSSGIPGGVPKGAEVDAGYSQWHADGTEIMNSGGRAPNTSSFCLGVWEETGVRQYRLNHFGTAWDPTKGTVGPAGPEGELIGPARIQEYVNLAPNGETFTGTFAIDQYDEAGDHLVHLEGTVTGTRITVTTPESSIF
jgi:hypothetical protein